jgi:hypothetical protein
MSSEGFSARYNGQTAIIPLGIDETFMNIPVKKTCRTSLYLPEDALILLTCGRLSPQTKSDLYPLINAFKKLVNSADDKQLILVIAGGASEKQIKMTRQIIAECGVEKSVHIISNFQNNIKPYLYGAADIYVSLSDNLQETFGISVIEAMAAGVPSVVSDINGYSELVTHNETGYKVPTLWTDRFALAELADIMNFETMQLILAQCMAVDTEELYHCLYELVNNNNLRTSLGMKAKKMVGEKYRWTAIIKRYEEVWDSLYEKSTSYSGEVLVRENPFLNRYLEAFSHYPTSLITETCRCAISPDGMDVIKTGKIPAPYADIGSLLNNAVILDILKHLSHKPSSVAAILALDSLPVTSDGLMYTLLWMAKYALIRIEYTH